jgi:hypothetical protein
MAVDATKLTAAPMPVTIGGKEYRMSPLSDKLHQTMTNWARAKFVEIAVEAAKMLDEENRKEIMSVALRDACKFEWNSANGAGIELATSLAGVTQLCFLSFRKEHPNITPEEIEAALLAGDPRQNRNEVIRVYRELNTVDVKNSPAPAE